ncbi:MAG: 5-oxoprolinase subunit PxpA [Burkholderiales bacterium]
MTTDIDLNCDMGESYGRWTLGADEEIMPFITSASVACGFHGGDPHVMRKTVSLALEHNVAIGSHPSLPDLMGFGRRVMDVSPQELKDYVCYQTGALREFVRAAGGGLQHVKAHGILYNMLEKDDALVRAIAEAARDSGSELIMMALASGKCDAQARKMGVRVASEGFADRAYNADGTLASRKLNGSLIEDPRRAAEQAVLMATEGKVRTMDGQQIAIAVQTICCHGDTPGAPVIVRAVREALEKAGCRVRVLREWLPAGENSLHQKPQQN